GRWWRYKWITFHPSLTLHADASSFALPRLKGSG
ncbi:DsbA family protein, partial [Escherichia coli]|nr:DsbA family protein [Escherichia coli]EFD5076433.1 DsbA family protein [Escherichia coli]